MWKEEEITKTFNSLNHVMKNLEDLESGIGLNLSVEQKEDLELAKDSVSKKIGYKQRMYVTGNEVSYAQSLVDGYFNRGMGFVKEEQLMIALYKAQDLGELLDSLRWLEIEGALARVGRDQHLYDLVEGITVLEELDLNIKNSTNEMKIHKSEYLKHKLIKRVQEGLKRRRISEKDMINSPPVYLMDWLLQPMYIRERADNDVLESWYTEIGVVGIRPRSVVEEDNDFYMKTINYIYPKKMKGSKAMDRVVELVVDGLYEAYNKGELGMMGVKALSPKGVMVTVGEKGEVLIRLYQDMAVFSGIKGTSQTKIYQKPYSKVTKKDIDQLIEFLKDYEKGDIK